MHIIKMCLLSLADNSEMTLQYDLYCMRSIVIRALES